MLIAALAAVIAGGGAALAALHHVRDRLSAYGPTTMSGGAGARAFVGAMAVLAGAVTYLLCRRLLLGPTIARRAWTLWVPRLAPRSSDYRTAELPAIADLVGRLEARGYRLEVRAAAAADIDVDPRTPLVGARFLLRDPRLGPRGTRVVVEISQAAGDGGGLGSIEARDTRAGACDELARFAIVELAALAVAGLTFRPDDSALSPDDVEALRAALPERPRALS